MLPTRHKYGVPSNGNEAKVERYKLADKCQLLIKRMIAFAEQHTGNGPRFQCADGLVGIKVELLWLQQKDRVCGQNMGEDTTVGGAV